MKIGAKITAGFLVVILIMAISAGLSYYLMEKIQMRNAGLQKTELILMEKTNRLAYNSAMKTAALRAYLLNGQSSALDEYNNLDKEDDAIIAELISKAISPQGKQMAQEVKRLDDAYQKIFFDKALPLHRAGNAVALVELMKNEAGPAAAGWRSKIEEYIKFREKQIDQGFSDADDIAENAQTAVLIALVVALVVGLMISWRLNAAVARPLRLAAAYLERLADRDYTVVISAGSLQRRDEIGDLARAMNAMIGNMQEILRTLAQSSEQLAASSQELTASAGQSANGAANVAASSEEIAAGLQTVSASAQQITASAENVGANLNQISHNAATGNQVAKTVEQQAVGLQQSAQGSRRSAVELYDDISKRVVQAIADARIVDEISSMAASIATIAGQTNLLALNAAIEAARAGEQGRGFAVVAEEVRKLAEESAKAVGGIQDLTKKVQAAIGVLVGNSDELLQFINGTVRKDYDAFVNVGEQYKKDADSFLHITGEIGDKLHQVSEEMGEINKAIEAVAATIEESATGTQVISRGTGDVSQSLEEITRAAGVLAETAASLNQVVVRFKI